MIKRKPTISVCMIVKNEIAIIEESIKRLLPHFDEVIVVDTGSDDGTWELLREIGEIFYRNLYPFKYNPPTFTFSQARNVSIDCVDNDWILILDADEELPLESVEKIKALVANPPEDDYPAMSFKLINHLDGGQINQHFMTRFFPNDDRIRYEGALHEQLVGNGIELTHYAIHDIVIHHYGYKSDTMKSKGKLKRNHELLMGVILSGQAKAFDYYSLGNNYLTGDQRAEALDAFLSAINLCKRNAEEPNWLPHCYSVAMALFNEQGEYHHANRLASESPDKIVDLPDFWVHFGDMHFGTKDYDIALGAYTRAIEMHGKPHAGFYDHKFTTWRPYMGIGNVYIRLKNPIMALNYYKKALSFYPENESIKAAVAQASLYGQA